MNEPTPDQSPEQNSPGTHALVLAQWLRSKIYQWADNPEERDNMLAIIQELIRLAQVEAAAGEDKRRLDHLEELLQHCPHAHLGYNEEEGTDCDETEDGLMPIGFRIYVDGCKPTLVVGETLRDVIDADYKLSWPAQPAPAQGARRVEE